MAKQSDIIKAYLHDFAELDFSNDPYVWTMYSFDWGKGELADFPDGPDEWQRNEMNKIKAKLNDGENIESVIRQAVASGNGVGKSALVSILILWAMSTYEDTKGVVTANTENQLRTKTWAEMSKWYRLCRVKELFILSATALYSADPAHERTWRIDTIPWSENNPEAFAGLHNKGKRILVIFDEASAIADAIWDVTEGALTDEGTQIIWLTFGNPTRNCGKFYDCFNINRHRWDCLQLDSRTVKITNKKQIQEWIDDKGENSDFVKIHVRGMFPSSSEKQFISVADVDAAFNKTLRPEQYEFAPKILTCDPAWEGDDELVIALRQGLYFTILRTMPKNDNDVQVATILAHLEDEHQADAVIIDKGFGTGIISAGLTMNRCWYGVWFQDKSPDAGCLNMRAYMWREMRDWLKSGGAIPDDKQLYADLIGPGMVARLDGKLQLESKKDMKKRGVPSPNKADCLALSFAIPVTSKNRLSAQGLHFAQANGGPLNFNGPKQFAAHNYKLFR